MLSYGKGPDGRSVWVRNVGDRSLRIEFAASLENRDGEGVTVLVQSTPAEMSANSVRRFRVSVDAIGDQVNSVPDSGRFTGELIVAGTPVGGASAEGVAPGFVDLELNPARDVTRLLNQVLFWPLLIGFLFVALRYVALSAGSRPGLGGRLGPVNFDFTKSFASTITVVGALLGTVLSADLLPEETRLLEKSEYTTLSLVFGALVILAGLVFAASERPTGDLVANTDQKLQGYVWAFLLSAMLIVWAAGGQLACLCLIVVEADEAGRLSTGASVVFSLLLVVSALALLVYTWLRMRWVVENKADIMIGQEKQTPSAWPIL